MINKIKGKIKDIALYFYEYSIVLCLAINKKIKKKWLKLLLWAICSPYIILKLPICMIYEYTLGRLIISWQLKREEKQQFDYDLAIVAIAKDEALYIKEWVDYYITASQCKLHIYVYDNGSSDNIREVLAPYVESGVLTLIDYPGVSKQLPAYDDAVMNYKLRARYMAMVDIDEFLMPTSSEEGLYACIDRIMHKKNNAVGIGVNWCIYGSSGYETRQEGLLMDIYLKRSDISHWANKHIKSICNPRFVKKYVSCHFPLYRKGSWSICSDAKRQRLWYIERPIWDDIRCNHYFCKSREEFVNKRRRGRATTGGHYDMSKYDEYDLNDHYDESMLFYSRKIHDAEMSK